jgi:hypothetical protein
MLHAAHGQPSFRRDAFRGGMRRKCGTASCSVSQKRSCAIVPLPMRPGFSPAVRLAFGSAFGTAFALGALACGGRSPLDDEATNVTADGGTGTPGSGNTPGSPPTGTSRSDGGPGSTGPGRPGNPGDPSSDGGIIGVTTDAGSSPVACATCVVSSCQKPILGCVEDTACRAVFQCLATKCLGTGGVDIGCALTCASGDPSGLASALGVFTCVTGDCGSTCSSVLGQVGGAGAGGIKSPLLSSPEALTSEARASSLRAVLSPWPELMSGTTATP